MTDTRQNGPEHNKNPVNHSTGYEVGYRKPPKHTQWNIGQSGNPKGRPKRHQTEDCRDLFNRISNEKIRVCENGSSIPLPGPKVLARSIVDRGIAGDPDCEKILIKIEQLDLTPAAGGLNIVDVDSDNEIPAKRRELLRRTKDRANRGAPAPAGFGRGRPRDDAPLPVWVKRELSKRIKVQVNASTVRITKREYWMRRFWNDTISGKSRALRLYMKLGKPTESPPEAIDFFIIGGRSRPAKS